MGRTDVGRTDVGRLNGNCGLFSSGDTPPPHVVCISNRERTMPLVQTDCGLPRFTNLSQSLCSCEFVDGHL